METSGAVAAILMASGFSKRFSGQDKLLFPFQGKPLARYTLELAAALDLQGGIFFVASSDNVAALAADLREVTMVKNPAPEKGLRESVRRGVEAANTAEYYLFFPCDMPYLDAATVRSIIDEREQNCIIEPRYNGRPGNPCLFSAAFREELCSLREGETPRLLKARHPEALRAVEVSDPLVLKDIDDEETVERLKRYAYGSG